MDSLWQQAEKRLVSFGSTMAFVPDLRMAP
jgi:hypothetical protein